jgi:aldehyde:ferredoxin oxidoreductase
LTMCKNVGLSMDILDFDFAARLLQAGCGLKFTPELVNEALRGVIERDRLMNIDFGIDASQDTLPKRFTHEPLKKGASKGNVVPVDQMVKEYYQIKGWDKNGIPSRKR